MPHTLQRKLQAIVGVTVMSLVVMAAVDMVTVRRTDDEIRHIEGDYLPLLDLGPAIAAGFDALSLALQEAVSAQDREALAATGVQRDQLLAQLDHAPAIIEPRALQELRQGISAWYDAALAISERLLQGEIGEPLVDAISKMQGLRRQAREQMQHTVMFDRRRLSEAFADARHAQIVAARIRMGVPLALTAVVAALGLSVSRKVVRSLRELTAGFERFGLGQFDRPVVVPGDDELTDLAAHANRMASSLRTLDLELRLRQAELERTNRELEAFSYSVSHDLRAPLRSIDGFSQALLEDCGELLPEEGRGYLGRVRAAAQRMAALIDDILRLSRVSRAELHWARVDLSALARTVGAALAAAEPSRSVAFAVEDGLIARGDPALLQIVFENLLGNAWKFVARQPAPKVEVGALPGRPGVFFVRDNGAGFDMAHADRLFTPFQRLHREVEFPGTGIGLATVQRILHRLGGRVWAEGAVGKGATIFMELASKEGNQA